jgi:hypothetical protein
MHFCFVLNHFDTVYFHNQYLFLIVFFCYSGYCNSAPLPLFHNTFWLLTAQNDGKYWED